MFKNVLSGLLEYFGLTRKVVEETPQQKPAMIVLQSDEEKAEERKRLLDAFLAGQDIKEITASAYARWVGRPIITMFNSPKVSLFADDDALKDIIEADVKIRLLELVLHAAFALKRASEDLEMAVDFQSQYQVVQKASRRLDEMLDLWEAYSEWRGNGNSVKRTVLNDQKLIDIPSLFPNPTKLVDLPGAEPDELQLKEIRGH